MRQIPILMRGEMVRATREDRKTQTRRVENKWGKVKEGDLLWVRETWQESPFLDTKGEIIYKAEWNEGRIHPMTWRPSIFMPKRHCRLWLRVTANARMERLQEISEKDCVAEGMLANYCPGDRRDRFALSWDSINAKRGYSWESNPWVWVIEFERTEHDA